MNKFAIALCSMAWGAVMLTSCNPNERLAEEVQGCWTGNPETLQDTGAMTASLVRVFQFTKGTTPTEGTVTMTAVITVENTMQSNDSIITPLQISASGTATITGVYQAKDDDELIVRLDNTSLSVSVDPDGVQLNYDVLTGDSAPMADRLKPGAAVLATQQINRAAQHLFSNFTEIEDIHINGDVMHCEVKDVDLVMTRSPQATD